MYTHVRKALQPADIARLTAACADGREKLVILALLDAGLRPDDLNRLEAEEMRTRASSSQALLRLLEEEAKNQGGLGLGKRQIQRIVRNVAQRAKIPGPVTPDVLRRTWLERTSGGSHRATVEDAILTAAAESALDLIMVADNERRFVSMNRAAAEALGLPREQALGRRIDEFFSEARGETVPAAWNGFIADGEQSGVCELTAADMRRKFVYRAKAHFVPGFHLSVLRELT
jgi:integrase/recombinase XerD